MKVLDLSEGREENESIGVATLIPDRTAWHVPKVHALYAQRPASK